MYRHTLIYNEINDPDSVCKYLLEQGTLIVMCQIIYFKISVIEIYSNTVIKW